MKSKIVPIASDASSRKFYRLVGKNKSKIIVFSEEEKYRNLIAYVAINNFLRKNKIFAPKLYEHNFTKGIIVIEDFGDKSFYDVLKKTKNKLLVYKKLVDLLVKIQKIIPQNKIKKNKNGFHIIRKYSKKYLEEESDLFFNWYLPLLFKKKKSSIIKKKGKRILSKIYNKLNFSNSYFVHRDFHVQNLINIRKKIGIIDNQDAIIGNPAYDLVSLIDDVRIKTSSKLKKQIYKYYLKKTSKIFKVNENKFIEDFNILSVQRSLKIIGIFSRLLVRDQKNQYMKFIPYTWKLLEMRMNNVTFLELKKILNKNISEKIRKKIIIR